MDEFVLLGESIGWGIAIGAIILMFRWMDNRE